MSAINFPLGFIGDFFSGPHLLVILFLGLLIWGKRLPEVARGLGKSIGEFKKGLTEGQNEYNAMTSEKPADPKPDQKPMDQPDKPS